MPQLEVITIRLDQNTLEELNEEYSQEGFRNRSQYIRTIIEKRDRIQNITTENTSIEKADILDRLEELEERVDDLEGDDQESTPTWTRDPHRAEAVDERDRDDVVDERRDVQEADPQREEMLDVLEDVHVPGTDARVERTRREAVKHAWDRLREEGEMQSRDIANDAFGRFFDDDLGYATASRYPGFNFWDNCLRDALKELPGVEAPAPSGRTWRYKSEN